MMEQALKGVFWERLTNHAALQTKCNFGQYRAIAEKLSKRATHLLIWTLHGSPVAVPELGPGFLTSHDAFFRDAVSEDKVRVVVFGTPYGARQYAAVRAHIDSGTPVPRWYRIRKSTKKLVARVTAFEAASKSGGRLYFTSPCLIASHIGAKFSRFDVGFVSDDSKHIYCFNCTFAASLHGEAHIIRDILFLSISDSEYPGAEMRRYYAPLLSELRDNSGGWYFEHPADVAERVNWPKHVLHWIRQLLERANYTRKNLRQSMPLHEYYFLVFVVGIIFLWTVVGLYRTVTRFDQIVGFGLGLWHHVLSLKPLGGGTLNDKWY